MRSNLVIAIGDLAFRFPNLLEPWTPHMYRSLADSNSGEAHSVFVRNHPLESRTPTLMSDVP